MDIVKGAEMAVAMDYYKDGDTYTDLGMLVYKLKYTKYDDAVHRKQDLNLLAECFISYIENNFDVSFDYIVPLPSYNPKTPLNKNGIPKIMYITASLISKKISIPLDYSSVSKIVNKQAKNGFLHQGDFHASKIVTSSKNINILLIDDLFGEGNSANFTIKAIKDSNPNARIYFISATNNKYGGLGKDVMASINFSLGIKQAETGKYYIVLNFMYNEIKEKCYIFDDHKIYPKVQDMFKILDTSKFNLKVKRNTKGFWNAI